MILLIGDLIFVSFGMTCDVFCLVFGGLEDCVALEVIV